MAEIKIFNEPQAVLDARRAEYLAEKTAEDARQESRRAPPKTRGPGVDSAHDRLDELIDRLIAAGSLKP